VRDKFETKEIINR